MKYQCSHCGSISKTNFYKSNSILNKHRGVMSICKDCIPVMYGKYIDIYKSEEKALYSLCMLLDVYYDEKRVVTSKIEAKENNRDLSATYMSKASLKQYANKSFIDSCKMNLEDTKNIIVEDVKNEEKPKKKSLVTPEMIQRWGSNREEDDYFFLEERFNMMCDTYDNKNIANIWQYQEIALNYLQIQKLRGMDDEKSTATAVKLMDSTSKMMNDCKMKSTQIDGSDDTDANLPGMWTKRIQNTKPIPEATGIFADPDGIQKLFDNQFVKPMRRVMGIGD